MAVLPSGAGKTGYYLSPRVPTDPCIVLVYPTSSKEAISSCIDPGGFPAPECSRVKGAASLVQVLMAVVAGRRSKAHHSLSDGIGGVSMTIAEHRGTVRE